MSAQQPRLALIGFGELDRPLPARANGPMRAGGMCSARRAAMARCGAAAADSAEEALAGVGIVLSLVTADSALTAAQDYARFLRPGTLWCDMNSVAPETKRAAAKAIADAGGRYVDVAVMAPVDPKALDVPLLLSGAAAGDAAEMLGTLGFSQTRIVGDEIGRASAIKMIRSVMVKGIEALSFECAEAARKAGVFDEVLASLDASEKQAPWSEKFAYNRERMETHGLRRAAEMEEAAKTLLDLGVEPVMTRGTVVLQRRAVTDKNKRIEPA